MKNSYEQSHEGGVSLGSGSRFSAFTGLLAYGVSRLALVTVWVLGGSAASLAAYIVTASIGLASIALAHATLFSPFLTRRYARLAGLLLASMGALRIVVYLVNSLSFSSQLPIYADIVYSLLLIYLGARLLRGSLTLSSTTFMALALLSVAALLRSVQIDYLLTPFRGMSLNAIWLRQLLYAVSIGLAFAAFVSASRWTHLDFRSLMRSREYALLRGAVLLYGLGELIIFTDMYVLRFGEFTARAAEYLGTVNYAITVYLWPLIDAVFALSIIAFAASMKQVTSQPETPPTQQSTKTYQDQNIVYKHFKL